MDALNTNGKIKANAKKAIQTAISASDGIDTATTTAGERYNILRAVFGIEGQALLTRCLMTMGQWPADGDKPLSYDKCKTGELADVGLIVFVNRFRVHCSTFNSDGSRKVKKPSAGKTKAGGTQTAGKRGHIVKKQTLVFVEAILKLSEVDAKVGLDAAGHLEACFALVKPYLSKEHTSLINAFFTEN